MVIELMLLFLSVVKTGSPEN